MKRVILIILGILFTTSSVLKMISLDSFELYIFSHNILNLNNSYIAARILISFEFLLGLFTLLNIYTKYCKYTILVTTGIFTLYILLFFNQSDNCHCFGDALPMNSWESLLKNIIIIALAIFIDTKNELRFKYQHIITTLVGITILALPFILKQPDFVYPERFAKKSSVNNALFQSLMEKEGNTNKTIQEGKKILCFFSTQCKYCKFSQQKLSAIFRNNQLDTTQVYSFIWGKEADMKTFYKEKNVHFQYRFIPPKLMLGITEGKMPLILLTDSGIVQNKFGYRDLSEEAILNFLKP